METAQPSPQFKRPAARSAGQPVMVSEWCWHTSRGGQQRRSRQWRLSGYQSPPLQSPPPRSRVGVYPPTLERARCPGTPSVGRPFQRTTLRRLGRLLER
ncbi:hypothetical protein MTO96_011953 [Rhipicephalus appendiculatus]